MAEPSVISAEEKRRLKDEIKKELWVDFIDAYWLPLLILNVSCWAVAFSIWKDVWKTWRDDRRRRSECLSTRPNPIDFGKRVDSFRIHSTGTGSMQDKTLGGDPMTNTGVNGDETFGRRGLSTSAWKAPLFQPNWAGKLLSLCRRLPK